MSTNNEFHLGLCLAGAISAGAYTAGVIDYLIEALDNWEYHKKIGNPNNVPQHKVMLSVIGGASAGGMTGMMMGVALNKKFDPVRDNGTSASKDKPYNPFYHAWVDQLDAKDPTRFPEMLDYLLDLSDIKNGKVKSFLNSTFVEEIANRIITAPSNPYHRAYVHKNLRVFATLTNLVGMEHLLEFTGDEGKNSFYHILDHKDYGCFTFTRDDVSDLDGWERVDYQNQSTLERYKKVAIGTGAFPLGLAPIELSRRSEFLNRHSWLKFITNDGKRPIQGDDYITTVVDGGMINNEPFEKVRDALNCLIKNNDENKNQDYRQFESTILMVDPFPSQSKFLTPANNLIGTLGNIVSTLINQVRVKPEHLVASLSSDKAGQYVISPVRYVHGRTGEEKIMGDKAIACGSLDGFGGFLSKKFRIHDFFLGRANCEKFLRDHFTVPENDMSPIFQDGYGSLDDTARQKFRSKTDKNPGLQIIPLFPSQQQQANLPEWPQIDLNQVVRYRGKIYNRTQKILLNTLKLNKRDHLLLWAGGKFIINRKITDGILNATIKSLKSHSQIKK